MEVENKLDEDFLFYLGFTNSSFNNIKDKIDVELCQAWLQKLCGEVCSGVDRKRARNIYLSNLVLCMQDGVLSEPFRKAPNDINIIDALEVFGPPNTEIQEPDWLQEVIEGDGDQDDSPPRDGRTYMATRTLPDGAGAFAYLAVSLAEQEPKWLGGGEGLFDEHVQEKFAEMVPPPTEMEKILARRKSPEHRERVMVFYDTLLQNIEDEMNGKVEPALNDTVNGLLDQLVEDLIKKGQYDAYKDKSSRLRRLELLGQLYTKVKARREKIDQREELLEEISFRQIPQSFFETSVELQDKYELPAAMWEQAINKAPNRRNMMLLQENYPVLLIEKFLELLSNHKEEIAIRMQKRHENIMSQLKRELRLEGEKGKKKLDDIQKTYNHIHHSLIAVRAARQKQIENEQLALEKLMFRAPQHSELYIQLRQALLSTQRKVEEAAIQGQQLAQKINDVNEKTEMYMQVNMESVRKMEDQNMNIMRNIKRLRQAIPQFENRIEQIRAMTNSYNQSITNSRLELL